MELLKEIKAEYSLFKAQLAKNINDTQNLHNFEDCFLIENSFIEELENYLKNNNLLKSKSKNVFFKNNLRIINNFEDAIKNINDGIKITLINKKVIELMGFNNLNNYNNVNYYCGNKKLIIEYKMNQKNKAFLIINPLDDIELKSKTYIIINNQIKKLYQYLLFIANDLKKNNYIISLKEYIMNITYFNDQNNLNNNKKINNNKNKAINQNKVNNNNSKATIKNNQENPTKKNINQNNSQLEFKRDLLKTFIYIFYYEQSCNEKKDNIFNNHKKYYVINPQWLDNYKEYYNYGNLYNLLRQNENKSINYNNIDTDIDNLIDNFLKNNDILNFEKRQLSAYLMKKIIYDIKTRFDIPLISKGIIIPSKIMKIIKKWNQNLVIYSYEIIFKNNYIYFIKSKNIIVGDYNDIPLFISKFAFIFNDEVFENEKKEILFHQINEYIYQRKCNEHNYDLQFLKNEENQELGKLIVINNIIFKKLSDKQNRKNMKRTKTTFRKVRPILVDNQKKGDNNFSIKNNDNQNIVNYKILNNHAINSNVIITVDTDQNICKENNKSGC